MSISSYAPSYENTLPGPETVVGRLLRLAATPARKNPRSNHTAVEENGQIERPLSILATSSIADSAQLYESFLKSMKSGQLDLAESLKSDFRHCFGILQSEVGENKELQHEMKKTMTSMLDLQRQANERLIAIQKGVQAILTQTYELLEYPIPRLFIVLPRECSRFESINPFMDKFRLYFLCECGEHTRSNNSTVPHHIHMAKHVGYDLDRPSEFFEKYGSYVLNILRMIKFGVSVAGFVVPPLAHFKLAEGLDEAKVGLEHVEKQLKPHFDTAIAYLERLQEMDTIPLDGSRDPTDQIQALEGAELRQVATFLKNQDRDMVLGNLYRTTTTEGHVKWVSLVSYIYWLVSSFVSLLIASNSSKTFWCLDYLHNFFFSMIFYCTELNGPFMETKDMSDRELRIKEKRERERG